VHASRSFVLALAAVVLPAVDAHPQGAQNLKGLLDECARALTQGLREYPRGGYDFTYSERLFESPKDLSDLARDYYGKCAAASLATQGGAQSSDASALATEVGERLKGREVRPQAMKLTERQFSYDFLPTEAEYKIRMPVVAKEGAIQGKSLLTIQYLPQEILYVMNSSVEKSDGTREVVIEPKRMPREPGDVSAYDNSGLLRVARDGPKEYLDSIVGQGVRWEIASTPQELRARCVVGWQEAHPAVAAFRGCVGRCEYQLSIDRATRTLTRLALVDALGNAVDETLYRQPKQDEGGWLPLKVERRTWFPSRERMLRSEEAFVGTSRPAKALTPRAILVPAGAKVTDLRVQPAVVYIEEPRPMTDARIAEISANEWEKKAPKRTDRGLALVRDVQSPTGSNATPKPVGWIGGVFIGIGVLGLVVGMFMIFRHRRQVARST
jgi:hypothetical protein